MNNMKLIMENWRKFQISEQETAKQTQQASQLKTFGDLKKLVNDTISGQKKSAIVSGGTTVAVDQLLGLIPGASNAKSAIEFFRGIYNATDDKKTNTVLDKINVDDEYSKIVDDKLEMAFLKYFSDMLMKRSDNEVIPPTFNVNAELQNYLKQKHKQRTLTFVNQAPTK